MGAKRFTGALHFGPDDPLFPKTRIAIGESGQFEAVGLERAFWSNAEPIRKAFREAFAMAGLPYFNPHSFRTTLARLGETKCSTPEAFKAWSQNLGHEGVLTTFTSYGSVPGHRQAEIFEVMRGKSDATEAGGAPDIATIQRLLAHMARQNAG